MHVTPLCPLPSPYCTPPQMDRGVLQYTMCRCRRQAVWRFQSGLGGRVPWPSTQGTTKQQIAAAAVAGSSSVIKRRGRGGTKQGQQNRPTPPPPPACHVPVVQGHTGPLPSTKHVHGAGGASVVTPLSKFARNPNLSELAAPGCCLPHHPVYPLIHQFPPDSPALHAPLWSLSTTFGSILIAAGPSEGFYSFV